MLKDLEDRASAMNDSLDRTATELAGHKKKLYDYEVSVVDLSNAADKARMKKSSMNLQREKLAGDKTNAGETYKTEHAEYVVVEPPAGKNAVCHFSSSGVIYH
jgi:chromosome segregation ATPase